MFKKIFILIGGIFMIPLVFSCSNNKNVILKRAMAERAVAAAKASMAEYSKCPEAAKNYFDAESNFRQGSSYMSNEYNWDVAEARLDAAIKLAEQAEEGAVLCDKK